jgi:hypothetical protein
MPITDTDNWGHVTNRFGSCRYYADDSGKLIEHQDYLVKPDAITFAMELPVLN